MEAEFEISLENYKSQIKIKNRESCLGHWKFSICSTSTVLWRWNGKDFSKFPRSNLLSVRSTKYFRKLCLSLPGLMFIQRILDHPLSFNKKIMVFTNQLQNLFKVDKRIHLAVVTYCRKTAKLDESGENFHSQKNFTELSWKSFQFSLHK